MLADQVTKAIAVASLERGEEVNVFLGLDMTYVRNEGSRSARSPAAGRCSWPRSSLAPRRPGRLLRASTATVPFLWLPVGLILGGALGNLADRAREGAVVDFIDPIAWPAFNLADAAIVVGVLGLLYVAEVKR